MTEHASVRTAGRSVGGSWLPRSRLPRRGAWSRCYRHRFPRARVDGRPGLNAVPIPPSHAAILPACAALLAAVRVAVVVADPHCAVRRADRPCRKCMDRTAAPHDGDCLGNPPTCATAMRHGRASPKRTSSPGKARRRLPHCGPGGSAGAGTRAAEKRLCTRGRAHPRYARGKPTSRTAGDVAPPTAPKCSSS